MSQFGDLLPPSVVSAKISDWLSEDMPSFDVGGYVVGQRPSVAHLLIKSPGVLAGVPFFEEVFKQVGCAVEWIAKVLLHAFPYSTLTTS